MSPDSISLSSLSVHLPRGLGPSAFHLTPPPPCPVILSLKINLVLNSVASTAEGDSMAGLGVNYSAVCKAIYALAGDAEREWKEPWELMRAVSQIPLSLDDVESVDVHLELPRALLQAMGVVYEARYTKDEELARSCTIRDLKVICVVGLHAHERGEKQRLEVDVEVKGCDWNLWGHKHFADETFKFVSESAYGTIESLIHELAEELHKSTVLGQHSKALLEITIRKPSAIPFATPSITIHRAQSDYSRISKSPANTKSPRVFIAVGSNIGDRVDNIRRAIKLLKEGGCELVGTSRLYESEPMYVEDQDRFVNGAIELRTSLKPLELLRLLKQTERAVGRTKTFTNGPRVIDLDLVFYGDEQVKIGKETDEEDEYGVKWLECPHKSLGERQFVLQPLVDIDPEYTHPALGQSVSQLWSKFPTHSPPPLSPIIPLHSHTSPIRLTSPSTPSIMAIFNATPDSFSDGDPARTDAKYALDAVEKIVNGPCPPAILDIGGMSTRPGSDPCSEDEELLRIIPLIKAIRASPNPALASIPISVDTYRPVVAKAAVAAGASIINDVRGGKEVGMLEVMTETDVPVVLMHSRGDSKSMAADNLQDYGSYGGVVNGVKEEMAQLVQSALDKGVKRWNIILDPGLGFAKSASGSLSLLKHLPELVAPGSALQGYPILVGGSRKGFVGKVVDRQVPTERGWGDAGVTGWAATSGVVDILRVHASREMGEVVKMVSAIQLAE